MREKSIPQQPQCILLVQYGSIGDTLLTSAAVKAVRCRFPKSFIGYVIESLSYPVMEHNPHLSKVFVKPKDIALPVTYPGKYLLRWDFFQDLRSYKFDLLLDFESNYRNTYLALLCGARFKAGLTLRGSRSYLNPFYQVRVPREELPAYRRDRYRGFLESLGIPARFTELEFYPLSKDYEKARAIVQSLRRSRKNKIIGINAGGPLGSEWKFWPVEKFAALADLLEAEGYRVILTAAPGEGAYVEHCQCLARTKPRLWRVQSLSEFAGLIDQMDLMITIDSGAKHLAVARKTPTLTLFGGDNDVKQWHPPDIPMHQALQAQAIHEISVLNAFDAAKNIMHATFS